MGKRKTYTVNLPVEMRSRISKWAGKHRRTPGKETQHLIETGLEFYENGIAIIEKLQREGMNDAG